MKLKYWIRTFFRHMLRKDLSWKEKKFDKIIVFNYTQTDDTGEFLETQVRRGNNIYVYCYDYK